MALDLSTQLAEVAYWMHPALFSLDSTCFVSSLASSPKLGLVVEEEVNSRRVCPFLARLNQL